MLMLMKEYSQNLHSSLLAKINAKLKFRNGEESSWY